MTTIRPPVVNEAYSTERQKNTRINQLITKTAPLVNTLTPLLSTLSSITSIAANTFLGNNTGGTAAPTALTATQAKAVLAIASSDVSGLAASATTDTTNATNISSGTLNAARLPATVALLTTADQTLSGGANVTSSNLGTKSSGTLTIDCGTCPLQYVTNGGAFTLAAPANDGSCIVLITNNGSAGTITFSGFTVGASVGDAFTTTNTSKFMLTIVRINGVSSYSNKALQ